MSFGAEEAVALTRAYWGPSIASGSVLEEVIEAIKAASRRGLFYSIIDARGETFRDDAIMEAVIKQLRELGFVVEYSKASFRVSWFYVD